MSPLRYPGGKRRLAPYVAEALRLNRLRPRLYVEPFAGGASVALQLLDADLVERVALGEKDRLVAGFWRAVFGDPDGLIAALRATEPSLALWEHYRRLDPATPLEWAMKCLYLNRTSFSGILSPTAGPIGGRRQASAHPIGCRFPVERLARRIRQIAAYAGRVELIHEGDWQELLELAEARGLPQEAVFYYLDPPFYAKADRLYRHAFVEADHQRLYERLGQLDGYYMLSYDPAPPIVARYSAAEGGPTRVDLLYSATAKGRLVRASELIVSNLPQLPERTRLWRSRLPLEPGAIAA